MERSCKKHKHFLPTKRSGSRKVLERVGIGQIPALVSGGTGPGLLHLQQSLNKSRVSGAKVKGGLGRERRGSVSAAGGQNPDPAGRGQRAPPFSRGLVGPVSGQC